MDKLKPKNRKVLKEWATAVKAMHQGRQSILLRKGGIAEDRDEFTLENWEFFLYPTYEHQDQGLIKPLFVPDLEKTIKSAVGGSVTISSYAVVQDVVDVLNLDTVCALSDYHIWSDEYMEERFHWRKDVHLQLLLLRVFRLPQPYEIPDLEEYGGCKSWIDLEMELSTEGALPVLSDEEFKRVSYEIRGVLS